MPHSSVVRRCAVRHTSNALIAALLVVAFALLAPRPAQAEGSEELDARDGGGSGAHDQALDRDTHLFVDILNNTGDFNTGNEKICWNGTGTLAIYPIGSDPWTGSPTALHTLLAGTCTLTALATVGAYPVRPSIDDQVVNLRWDIRVCDFDDTCVLDSANERTGRIWSTQWIFELGVAVFTEARANNGSVFAIVPGGDVGLDAVIEMTLDGVSGANYRLYANSIGPQVAATNARVGRSVARDELTDPPNPVPVYEVIPELKLYLNPPEVAQYNWRQPEITAVEIAPSCGAAVVLDTAAGTISFDSNVTGQYVVICDVNDDAIFDFADSDDFSSFGTAIIGNNVVAWNGRDNNNVNAAAGTYDCIIRLNVGEFHYVGEDIETAFPGIRMFRVESNKTTRTPVNMFWDDALIAADAENMPTTPMARPSPSAPEPGGLDPVGYATAANAFRRSAMGVASGNARAWGNFDGDGKGNETFLDTFSAADTDQSPIFTIDVITAAGDADTDTLTNARECTIGSDPQDVDSDDDDVNDGFEASSSTLPNTDGPSDLIPNVLDPDDDGDGINTIDELGNNENGDGNPSDAANSDGAPDGADYLDVDSDNDGVDDGDDLDPTDPLVCQDSDADACDDCANTGNDSSGGDPDDDGTDTDGDGDCDTGLPGNPNDGDPDDDNDDDNDGVNDGDDSDPLDETACRDTDADSCDDCINTAADQSGGDPDDDGPDANSDGICDLGELDGDGDGVLDPLDLDLDNDGVPNTDERDEDTDGDGLDNERDLDSDGDGLSDLLEAGGERLDADGDGVIDEPVDANSDGLHDPLQVSGDELPLPNSDDDAEPDFLDLDSDADGLLDLVEAGSDALDPPDTDGDDDDDFRDADDDGDGIPTAEELADAAEFGEDLDEDDKPNHLDTDTDGDGRLDSTERAGDGDANDNSTPDYVEPFMEEPMLNLDADEDGLLDEEERDNGVDRDTDGDGIFDFEDRDDDNDGILTDDERTPGGDEIDTDADGRANHLDADDDGDGVPTEDERTDDGDDQDSDEDGMPDHLDVDDDGDGINTDIELSDGDELGNDVDGDGLPNYLDPDSDGDGTPDAVEAEQDDDGNNVPDYLEPAEEENQGAGMGVGGFAGGALCSISSAPHSSTGSSLSSQITLGMLALCALVLRARKRTRMLRRNTIRTR